MTEILEKHTRVGECCCNSFSTLPPRLPKGALLRTLTVGVMLGWAMAAAGGGRADGRRCGAARA